MIKGSSVAVIGGAGFLGSHLVNYLVKEKDCYVSVLDNLITGQKKHIHEDAEFTWFDIRDDEKELAKHLENVDYVFNYAAEPYIPECFERPMHFFDINARAVLQVLNACQIAGVDGILQMSSAEIYGDATGKINEEHAIAPHSTYGVSKVAADGLVQVRWREAAVPAIALRQFNCVGERETHDYVVPEIISQLSLQKGNNSATIHLGNNTARDFMYAGDQARLAVELLESERYGEVFNMGSESFIKIYDLAELISRLMGFESLTIKQDPNKIRPWDIEHLESDNTKLHNTISGRATVGLQQALIKTIEYFESNGNGWDW
ncbi:NAD-dependent epimerase/dehydratase family protein [bacterium]|nr:NAD-dependent epimerase/dehydratase family protein [bacterium]